MAESSLQKPEIATITIAELYTKQGHYDKAVETCEAILARDPDNKTAAERLSKLRDKISASSRVDAARPEKGCRDSADVISALYAWLENIRQYRRSREASLKRAAVSKTYKGDEAGIALLEEWLQKVRLKRRGRAPLEPPQPTVQPASEEYDARISRLNDWLSSIRKAGRATEGAGEKEICKPVIDEEKTAGIARLEAMLESVRANRRIIGAAEASDIGEALPGKTDDAGIGRLENWLANLRSHSRLGKGHYAMQGKSRAGHSPNAHSQIVSLENWLGRIMRLRGKPDGL